MRWWSKSWRVVIIGKGRAHPVFQVSLGIGVVAISSLILILMGQRTQLADCFRCELQERDPASAPNLIGFISQTQLPGMPTPSSLLPIALTTTQLQSQMQAGIPVGTPIWDGVGQLPNTSYNWTPPSFTLESMGCSTVPVTISNLWYPTEESLPGISCDGVSNLTQPYLGSGSLDSSQNGGARSIPASAASTAFAF